MALRELVVLEEPKQISAGQKVPVFFFTHAVVLCTLICEDSVADENQPPILICTSCLLKPESGSVAVCFFSFSTDKRAQTDS